MNAPKNLHRVWISMLVRFLPLFIFFAIPGLSYLSADVYRWSDEQGTVHFGNRPPSEARDVQLMFKESGAAPAARSAAGTSEGRDTEDIIRELEEELRREAEEQRRASEIKRHAPPGRGERIAREKASLQKKIEDLEAQPIEYFGSQKNKRTRIGFYQYRLESLEADPDTYFKTPETFEGNVIDPTRKQ
jgi:hypothetical protein